MADHLWDREDVLEITALLHAVWGCNAKVDVIFIGKVTPRLNHLRQPADVHAMTTFLRAILSGQLQLRNYGSLVCAVTIKYDGSGGTISFGKVSPAHMLDQWPRFCPDVAYVFDFVKDSEELGLSIVKRKTCRYLTDLPCELLGRICSIAIRQDDTHIDIDADTGVLLGLAGVNRKLHSWCFEKDSLRKHYTLTAIFDDQSTSLSFDLLRNVFVVNDLNVSLEGSISHSFKHHRHHTTFELDFKLGEAVPLEDLRISISCLPFIIDTSSLSGHRMVKLRTCASSESAMLDESYPKLHELRSNIVKAMINTAFIAQDRSDLEVWTNGRGEVVESHTELYPSYI